MSDLEQAGRRLRESQLVAPAPIAQLRATGRTSSRLIVAGLAAVVLLLVAAAIPLRESLRSHENLAAGGDSSAMLDYSWFTNSVKQFCLNHGDADPHLRLVLLYSTELATQLVGEQVQTDSPGDLIYVYQATGDFSTSPITEVVASPTRHIWVGVYTPSLANPTPGPAISQWRDTPLDLSLVATRPASEVSVVEIGNDPSEAEPGK